MEFHADFRLGSSESDFEVKFQAAMFSEVWYTESLMELQKIIRKNNKFVWIFSKYGYFVIF